MKATKVYKWSYSGDNEYYHKTCDTREEAIKEGIKYLEGSGNDCLYIGQCCPVRFEVSDMEFINIEEILLDILAEEVGECGENWELSKEQNEELNTLLGEVLVKYLDEHNLQPNCYNVRCVEKISVCSSEDES